MTQQAFLQLCLVLHITGFTMMAGTAIADFTIFRRVGKYLTVDKQKALTILEGSAGLMLLIMAGAALLVLSGIGMVFIFKGTVAAMLWFRIKMVVVVSVLILGAGVARPAAMKLREALRQNTAGSNDNITSLGKRLRTIGILQITLFLLVFVLSIYRF